MKNILKCAIVFIVIITMVFMARSILKKSQHNKEVTFLKKTLPAFRFYRPDSTVFYGNSLPNNQAVVILFFDPDCEFCDEETKDLSKHLKEFKYTNILLVSQSTPEKITSFSKAHDLSNKNNIYLLWDKQGEFSKWFGHVNIPSTFVYDSTLKLCKQFNGEVSSDKILKLLN